jgi:hypothetical protein
VISYRDVAGYAVRIKRWKRMKLAAAGARTSRPRRYTDRQEIGLRALRAIEVRRMLLPCCHITFGMFGFSDELAPS